MFTGLIEGIGKIERVSERSGAMEIMVTALALLPDLKPGESVSVDGVCLTVEKLLPNGFSALATVETLSRSTLKNAKAGLAVNLERALRLNDRMGGHIVQGHVDTVGTVLRDRREGETLFRTVRMEGVYMKYVVEKGSVAVDGVSLTVAEKGPDGFTVAVIPETLKRTTLGQKKNGDAVNIEADILAKYTESLLAGQKPGLTEERLRGYGY
ncbi:MAG: riboflavin synthase [Fibrobacterota bacterium]